MSFDYIIIGAGIAGITCAEEIANVLNKKVLLIDKRDHIGGNCYDYTNEEGTIIHKYGPHIIHTNSNRVYNYLSLFTLWNIYNHKVLYKVNDSLIPVPFNLISIDKCIPLHSDHIKDALLEEYEVNSKVPIKELRNSSNKYLKLLGDFIYDNIFLKDYEKLYGLKSEELDEFVDKMLPVEVSYDCRYYDDIHQVIPSHGYTNMFQNMLSNHDITIMLEKDYHEIIDIDYENKKIYYEGKEFRGHLIFTGMIDEFFNYRFGRLPYRSLILLNEDLDDVLFQDNATIYYPEEYHFRRITEFKYLTGQQTFYTTIQFEFPTEYDINNDEQNIPYYPVDLEKNRKIYEKYHELSQEYENITFIGRLAEYKYLRMDEVVEKVLDLVGEKFIGIDTEK
ncbi:MAG: UDP-galactopyranose mutase [Methanosphaera sp.]|nr:UDP-galactopyranose mutase [Methanosphaera sp.]